MKKITIAFFISFISMSMLSGCVTISPTEKLASALGGPIIKRDPNLDSKNTIPKMIQKKENICNPSVGILSSLALSNTMGVNLRDSIKALDRPLIQELVKNSSEFRMLDSDLLSNEFNLEESKFKLIFWNPIGFINAIDELSNILLLNNHNSKKNIASGTEYAKSEELEKMLRFYVKEYLNGKFVLRDGTRLSKPDGKITHERAKVEVDDKTVEKSFFVTSFEVSAIT